MSWKPELPDDRRLWERARRLTYEFSQIQLLAMILVELRDLRAQLPRPMRDEAAGQ